MSNTARKQDSGHEHHGIHTLGSNACRVQVALNFVGRAVPAIGFKTPGLYRVIRHPIYLGLVIAVWATPTMTARNLLLAAMTTAYVFVCIALEERDLVATFGEPYRRYRSRVAMLLPGVL